MNLYIMLQDGQPINHPMLETNVLMVFPGIDLNALPENLCRFIRVERPILGVYQLFEEPEITYEIKVDGICYDVWHYRDMTAEEKQAKIDTLIQNKPYPSWTINIENCTYNPPVAMPTDGKLYRWNEDSLNWLIIEE
jgi:hypothetical protein